MSLFKLKDWWSTTLGHGEQFSGGGLAAGIIDNSGKPRIVSGSLQGWLRVHNPLMPNRTPDSTKSLLLEVRLDAPIYQLKVGRAHAIAVLHPSKLRVCTCSARTNQGSSIETSHLELTAQYIHDFEVTNIGTHAFSMCLGSFGGSTDREMILVQHMDGHVTIYDYDVEILCHCFQDCLAPGPIEYVQSADAFVTSNVAMSIACYKFQALAHSTNQDKSASLQTSGTLIEAKDKCVVLPCNSNKTRRVVTADWICNVGELILSFGIAHVRMTSICQIVALGEHTLFIVSVDGVLQASKLMDFHPTSLCICPTFGIEVLEQCASEMNSSPHVCCDVDNIIVYGSDARVYVLNSALQVIWVACGGVSKPLSISLFSVLCTTLTKAGMMLVVQSNVLFQLHYCI